MSFVANKHPRLGRVTTDGVHLLITDMSTDDTTPVSDCTNTESGGWFVAGEEGGVTQITGEFTAILLKGSPPDVVPGQSYAASFHHGSKDANTAYTGTFYVENVRQQGQVSQAGPSVFSGRGTFTGTVTRPTA